MHTILKPSFSSLYLRELFTVHRKSQQVRGAATQEVNAMHYMPYYTF